MKFLVMLTASVCMFVLSGCMSVSEPGAPSVTEKLSANVQLSLDNFQLYSVREKQYNDGSGTTYERMLDDKFPGIVKDIFESAGANIGTEKPQLKIEGRIGDGHFMWNSAAMWYRDVPVFVVSVCTLGMVITRERENDVRLIVYNTKGKRLKEYNATESYYTSGFGLPISGMINDRIRSWYCDRMAAKFALIKCVNEFIRDYNNGFYK